MTIPCDYNESEPGCRCFTYEEVIKLGKGLTDRKKCRAEMAEKDLFIEEHMLSGQDTEFWQEPEIIIGGVVVSFSAGAIIGYLFGS
jgi:hypothetical protein